MERQFKTLSKSKNVDLIPYVKEYMEKFPDTEILIGCDSQNRKKETVYAITIGLNNPGKGAHVLYCRYFTPREKINMTRLLNEVWASVETAEYIKHNLGIVATWVDIDLNEDKKYKSNEALRSAVGLVEGMGYHVRHKGLCPMMTYASDSLVK